MHAGLAAPAVPQVAGRLLQGVARPLPPVLLPLPVRPLPHHPLRLPGACPLKPLRDDSALTCCVKLSSMPTKHSHFEICLFYIILTSYLKLKSVYFFLLILFFLTPYYCKLKSVYFYFFLFFFQHLIDILKSVGSIRKI